jgi:DMSO/TMAO reductase YedYZ molybdopterin-dependent catalytic subunit
VFDEVGEYTVTVIAAGYNDATLKLEIKPYLTISGAVSVPKEYTVAQLEKMPQKQEVYSCINTWPTKKWYVGKGVALSYLLGREQADIKSDATLIKFTASDGYYMTLTVQELLKDSRYRFPNFKGDGGDGDGHLPGDSSGKVEVETILGLVSAEGTDNPDYMNDLNALLLMPGQRTVTEQTGPLFVKNVNKIEVLTDPISQWDKPTASEAPGKVLAGTKVELHSENDDDDKVHYTLDGSTPTQESPIYNWVASRWWSQRGKETVAEINRPIEITKDTTIKAITIGPGKRNSEVATFTYKVIKEVTGGAPPDRDSEFNFGDKVLLKIPAGALDREAEVKIEHVEDPPPAPAGCKLLSGVYEFSVDGQKSYSFAKKVMLKFSFEPEALAKDETPAIHYFDEDQSCWINIGGTVSDNTISVEVDHLTKYAVMVSLQELLAPPALAADSTDNTVGKSMELTFEDDAAWRAAITAVCVDGEELQKDNEYSVSEGKIVIAAGIFTSAGNYNIVIKAEGYDDATVTQPIKTGSGSTTDPKSPPALTADTGDIRDIKVTFTDDAAWRAAITDVTVNGKSIAGKYDREQAEKITIDYDVFDEVGEYTVTVIAAGYNDATLKLEIKPYLTISGAVSVPKEYTVAQLEKMPQKQEVYSCINTWPTKKWYVGKGVALSYLLGREQADIKSDATLIKFTASDGYYMTLTVQELLKDSRYRFPNFKGDGGDGDGHLPGDSSGKVEVETILGLVSAEGTDNPDYMNDLNALLLMPGQRTVTEQTGPLFVKNVNKIEVLTDPISQWDKPTASEAPGKVLAGTKVELHSENDDDDKVHYTLDGSTPTQESPIYNWVASRWWSQRGKETVAEINRPIEITKDTTIKAITIGPGKRNSEVATFTYKVIKEVTGGAPPDRDSEFNFGDKVLLKIPAGALDREAEVKIEHVEDPPPAPAGCKLLSGVYEFSVDGQKSYSFAKKVMLKFSFEPEALAKDETPAIHYFDEDQSCWINIGGTVSDNTISVEVDHLTKFAVMAVRAFSVSEKITPAKGGTISLGSDAIMEIPAGALAGSKAVEVKIERVEAPPAAPAGYKFLSDVFEFSIDGQKSYSFAKKVTLKFGFDSKSLDKDKTPAIHHYDEAQNCWVNIGGKVSGNTISVEVDHLTKYAVMVSLPITATATIKPAEGGRLNLGEEAVIEIPAGALTGSKAVEVKIERVETPPTVPAGYKFLSDVFEFSIDGQKSYSFAKKVMLKFGFDPKALAKDETPAIHYFDEDQSCWINIGGTVSDNTITVEVDHLTQFAVMAPIKIEIPQLTDIAGHWAYAHINKLVALGVLSGYPDGSFRPDNNITRAEFATVLVKAFQLENKSGKVFADTAQHWAKGFIATAASNSIVNGYAPHTFGPDDPLTREQMAVMIAKAAKLSPSAGELLFADSSSISDWARSSLAKAVENGIINGYPDNTVRPQSLATRAEAVTVIVKALEMRNK